MLLIKFCWCWCWLCRWWWWWCWWYWWWWIAALCAVNYFQYTLLGSVRLTKWAEMLRLSTGADLNNLPLPTGPSWTLSCMVGFWHWHIPTMVGFCHGGNMPASHRHHHHHHVDHHHLYNCMITTILIVVQHLWGGSRGVWSTVDEVNNKCPPGSTSFTNVTQIHFFNFDWNSYIQMVLQSW